MRELQSKYTGRCAVCGQHYPAGTLIRWDQLAPKGKRATHASCAQPQQPAAEAAQQAQPAAPRQPQPAADATHGGDVEAFYRSQITEHCDYGFFDSMESLMDAAQRPQHADRRNWQYWVRGGAGRDWLGMMDAASDQLGDVCRKVSDGWTSGADKLAAAFDGLTSNVTPKSVRRVRVRRDMGAEVDITDYWRGRGDVAWTTCERQLRSGPRRVTLVCDAIAFGSLDAEQMFWRGAAVAALADKLNAAGYSVQVVSAWLGGVNSGKILCRTVVKPFTAPIDMPTLAAGIACPAFFRSIGHAWGCGNAKEHSSEGFSVVDLPRVPGEYTMGQKDAGSADTARSWVEARIAEIDAAGAM